MHRSLCERISVLVSDYRLWRGKQKQVDIRSTLLCPQLPFLRICYSVVIIWVLWKNKTFYDLVFGLQCNLAAGVMLGKLHRFALCFTAGVPRGAQCGQQLFQPCLQDTVMVCQHVWEFQENISTIIIFCRTLVWLSVVLFIVVVRLRYASPTYEPLGVIRCVINYFFQISGNQNWSLFIYFNMRPFICCCTINVDK